MLDLSELAEQISPDGVVQTILGLLGVNSLVIGLIAIVMAVQAWVGIARSAIAQGPAAAKGFVRISSMRPIRLAVSILSTALVPIAQFITLWFCYLLANSISVLFSTKRQDEVNDLIAAHPELAYDLD